MNAAIEDALERMRQNATLNRVFTDLENAGWTIHGNKDGEITCTHPQLDSAVSLLSAQQIQRKMNKGKIR